MRAKVKKIIDDWDAADLLCIHCPNDEYDDEIGEIVKVLPNIKSVEELALSIQNIFTEYFGKEYPEWKYRQCLIVAERIISS